MNNDITYFAKKQLAFLGKKVFDKVVEETKKPLELQTKTLLKIVEQNKDTEYGKKYNFDKIKSVKDYQKLVPIVKYEDISNDLERMLNGETNVLTCYKFDHMCTTAGTTGKSKTIPFTVEQQEIFKKYQYFYNAGLIASRFNEDYLKGREFTPIGGGFTTHPSGITTGCATTKAAQFIGGMDAIDKQMSIMYTSPCESMNLPGDADSKYIHMRFALMDKEMTSMSVPFFSYLVQLLHYVEVNYQLLIDDIENGTISSKVILPDDIREKLLKKIQPMPERAAELKEIFKDGPNVQFVPLIWPNLVYIVGVGGAGFAIYDKVVREKYTGDKIARLYSGITSSEGLWSYPRDINTTEGVLAAGGDFMEFLPVDAEDDFSQIKTIDQLEVGKIYELIITNYAGFYRYRMSDAVKVVDFMNETPTVEYMYRVNRTINIGGEKLTEAAINLAVENLCKKYDLSLVDFNVYADKEQTPGQHQFLFEFPMHYKDVDLESLREKLLKELYVANERMIYNYEHGNFAMPKIYRLQPETNILYREIQLIKGKPASQIKPVRIIDDSLKKFFYYFIEK